MAIPPPLQLRPSRPSDASEIATLFAYSCKQAYSPIFPAFILSRYIPTKQLDRWTNHLNVMLPEHRVIVATSTSNEILGFIEVGPSTQQDIGEIHYLFVLPTATEGGVGTTLLRAGEQWLHGQGFKNGLLWVFCGNEPARRFYTKEGWQESGVVQQEPSLLEAGASVMECKLQKTFGSSKLGAPAYLRVDK
jgi:GNAT superfamily N-acetyltransferase